MTKRIDEKVTWKSVDGKRLYQWDSQHGEIEVFNAKNGYHLGSVDKTNKPLKNPVRGRRLSDV